MVNPDGKETVFSRLFSAYMGGARKYKNVNEYLYQPSRPAVSIYYTVYIVRMYLQQCITYNLAVCICRAHTHT